MIRHTRAPRVVAIFVLATVGSVGAQQVPNTSFRFSNPSPAFEMGSGPSVCVDGGHHNFHTLEGRYQAFGRLVREDGFRVAEIRQFTEAALSVCEIVVVANAVGPSNAQEAWQPPHDSAFPAEEITALVRWVHGGGSLLLIVDHRPWPGAASDLALLLGVQMFDGSVSTSFYGKPREAALRLAKLDGAATDQQREQGERRLGRRGSLGTHSILRGRSPDEAIRGVVTFGGSAFYPSLQIHPLLIVGPDAVGTVPDEPRLEQLAEDQVPRFDLSGWLAGGALERDEGRVVLLGEAATCTAQDAGADRFPMGMNNPIAEQNAQFCLNAVRWLARVLEP